MPYDENIFDTVLLISILEHLKPDESGPGFFRDPPGTQAWWTGDLWGTG